jgi:molybdopterin/thiamine biosynthesis adenylyltransferase
MPTAGSPDPKTLHEAELDRVITDLVTAGFVPRSGDRHHWIGPISPSLHRLTTASEMRLEIRDGWPYLHPYLHVGGLAGRKHVNAFGNVCLWYEDDDSFAGWLRLDTIMKRIDTWVADQESGVADPALDAHLYFGPAHTGLLAVDIDGLIAGGRIQPSPGRSGLLLAQQINDVFTVGVRGNLQAGWFWHPGLTAPPAEPSRLRDLLTPSQHPTYDAVARSASRSHPGVLLVLWSDSGVTNALGARVRKASAGRHTLDALEVARTDASVLRLRSGPDAPALSTKKVAIFGVGAIGSEIAVLLARSGVGELVLVDRDRLRPANMSRHAASGRTVGMPKPRAMAQTIREALSDVRVDTVETTLWEPSQIARLVAMSHLVIDATANRAYTDLLSRITADQAVPLVSAALHRGGRIARVRVQVGDECPLWTRSEAHGVPEIPPQPGPLQAPTWETGCGAPVNNAPPVSVAAAAVLATRAALDVLSGRDRRERDVVEVYEPIEAAPFTDIGIKAFEAHR